MPTTFEIHPCIGIARVGNSTDSDGFFIGRETPDPALPDLFRDSAGRLKRQAARYRVFKCQRDANGGLLEAIELTPADAAITWSVHLANRKAAAPKFGEPGSRRNNASGNPVTDAALIIDAGPRSIGGTSQTPVVCQGAFRGHEVVLGELRTDENGRLILLGGFGKSQFVPTTPSQSSVLTNFANNDNWCDDTSDGPVSAVVQLKDGSTVNPLPARVIVGPPDFAPQIDNLITLYDAIYDVAVRRAPAPAPAWWPGVPAVPSFLDHINPILMRVVGYQWVNGHANDGHGPGGAGDFVSMQAVLSNPTLNSVARQRIFNLLRRPGTPPSANTSRMPRLNDHEDSGDVLPLTETMYTTLQKWAAGSFVLSAAAPPEHLPELLDRVALQCASGGAFFPGIEVGSVILDPANYVSNEPFRILPSLIPGGLTAGNALPWQADFMACAFEGHSFLGWWPAQRPDDVLLETDLGTRVPWDRGLGSFRDMVDHWHQLGLVRKKIVAGLEVFVETERTM